jgi:hypothetical protein
MPISLELTADEASNKSVLDIRNNFDQYYSKIADEIRIDLTEKGYKISGVSPSIKELTSQKSGNIELIRELMGFLRRQNDIHYKFIYEKTESEITIKQKNPLMDVKTQPLFSIPAETDAILLVEIKTHIGKRKLFGNLSEKSTLGVYLELFDFKQSELAFKNIHEETKTDISEFSKAKETIKRAFSKLPIKI